MAKRRLNKKFVAILGGSVLGAVGLGAGGIYLKQTYFKEKPDKYFAQGKADLAAGNFDAARQNLTKAESLSQPDPALDTALGDSINGLTSKEVEYVNAARQMWEHAVGVDPTYVPALERLVGFWRDDLDMGTKGSERSTAADQLKRAADKLVDVDSKNALGLGAQSQATIELMLDGRSTPPSKINDAEAVLLRLAGDQPDNADFPFWIARSRLRQAADAARSDDTSTLTADLQFARKIIGDAAKARPENAALAYRNGQVLLQMAAMEHVLNLPQAEVDALAHDAVTEADRAHTLIKPADLLYVDINLYDARLVLNPPESETPAARAARQRLQQLKGDEEVSSAAPIPDTPLAQSFDEAVSTRHKTPERILIAERIYRDVLDHIPNEPFTRLALSQLLGDLPGKRAEAIELLTAPMAMAHAQSGIKGTILPLLQSECDIRLLGLRLDDIDANHDLPDREKILQQCVTLSERILGKSPDSPAALGLKGRLQLIQGQLADAPQTLRRALALIDAKNVSMQRTRYELTFFLARAYEAAQQTGEAKKLANDVIVSYPNFIPARLMMARLAIAERDMATAKTQLDYLTSIIPANPQLAVPVLRMRLGTIDPERDPDQFKSLWSQLPEQTRDDKFDKARIAQYGKLDDEAILLLADICKLSPADVPAVQLLASLYAQKNQVDLVKRLVAAAIAAKPDDLTLIAMQMRLDGKTQAEIDARLQKLGAGAPDQLVAFNQEMTLASTARQRGDGDGVDQHLAAAQKIKPNDPALWDAMFSRAIDKSAWDQALSYLEKLSSNDIDHAGGALYRIRLAIAQNDLNKALDLSVKLTRDKPEFSQSWCVRGDAERSLGKYDDAVGSYQFALDRQVQNLDALHGLVQCAYATNKPEAAKAYIDRGLKIEPNNAEFKELSLTHELTYGDPQNVIVPREKNLQADPENPLQWLGLAETYLTASRARTVAKDADGGARYAASAEQTLRDAMARFPTDNRFPLTFAKVALSVHDISGAEQVMTDFAARPTVKDLPATAIVLSDFFEHANKPDRSIEVLRNYLQHPATPADVEADVSVELRLSTILARLGRHDEALAALSGHADRELIAQQKISLLINSRRLAEADQAMAAMSVKGPLSPALQTLNGQLQIAQGRPDAALETFDRLLSQHPDDVDALLQRAHLYLDSGVPNYRAAQTDFIHARDVDPTNIDARFTLVQMYRKQGKTIEAVKELENGVRKVPTDKKLRLTLVDLYAAGQQWDDANRVLHDAAMIPSLASDPDFIHAGAVVSMGRGDYPAAEQQVVDAMNRAPENLAMVKTYYDILIDEKASGRLLSHSDALLAAHNNDPSLGWVYPFRAAARIIDSADRIAAANELQLGLASAGALHDDAAVSAVMASYTKLLGTDAALKVATDNANQNTTQGGHWQLVAARLCSAKDDFDTAIHWYEMALSHFDTLSNADQAVLLRSAAADYQNTTIPDLAKAADMYRRLLSRNSMDVPVLNDLSCLLAEPGPVFSPKEALSYGQQVFDQMTVSGTDDPLIMDTYASALIANGRATEAIPILQQALAKKDFADARYHLAEAFLKQSPASPDEAGAELTKAIRLLDQDEQQGRAVRAAFKTRVKDELKRVKLMAVG